MSNLPHDCPKLSMDAKSFLNGSNQYCYNILSDSPKCCAEQSDNVLQNSLSVSTSEGAIKHRKHDFPSSHTNADNTTWPCFAHPPGACARDLSKAQAPSPPSFTVITLRSHWEPWVSSADPKPQRCPMALRAESLSTPTAVNAANPIPAVSLCLAGVTEPVPTAPIPCTMNHSNKNQAGLGAWVSRKKNQEKLGFC